MPLPESPSERLKLLKTMLIEERRAATRTILELHEANGSTVGLSSKVAEIAKLQDEIEVVDRAITEETAFERRGGNAKQLRPGTP